MTRGTAELAAGAAGSPRVQVGEVGRCAAAHVVHQSTAPRAKRVWQAVEETVC
ncbi:hypothetical protein [Bradyrhizobium sp. CCGB20]|uniref:hypothetical protein n=1 Tax=Bradyrhizobium sp. CCGB20 TaxID=2949633 RepID=UPI0020B401E1|nr:hypothetical protein [Bradyrhizobium sp. CCGB20]MCP3397823.1 hypothetical protein [Bradyrhizobium sp. CCGB20]